MRAKKESQHHRAVGLGRDPWDHPAHPLLKQALLQQLLRITARRALDVPREGDCTASLGSLSPCSGTLKGKKFFLLSPRSSLCCSLCPLPLVLSLGTADKSPAPAP